MSKIKHPLKKKNKFKVEKQKLIDRINQCKTQKELEGWKKTFAYYDVLKDDEQWDHDFFFNLIEFKLKKMAEYFYTHNIVVDEAQYGRICDKLIAILHAGYKTNIIVEEDLHNYVNTRNVHRFFSPRRLEFMSKEGLQKYYLPTIREEKAKRLFWKYMYNRIEWLWD